MECIPCFFKQALAAAKIAKLDEHKIKEIFDHIAKLLPDISMNTTPPEIGMLVYKAIYNTAGITDPFKEIKEQCTVQLMSRYNDFKKQITQADDPLYTALRYACLGNAIDLGANPHFAIMHDLENLFDRDFDVCHYDKFKGTMKKASAILYIADNAGETVFDRLLIEQLAIPVMYAVRSQPIINDAVFEDAKNAGIDKVAEIITSGCDAPGTILELCSEHFKEIFNNADMIISKGQGNYETLSDQNRPLFFLLQVKCPIIARDIDITCGSMVLISKDYEK
ncbi:MAG: ARMT1-like domain-containing protein [bacterium]